MGRGKKWNVGFVSGRSAGLSVLCVVFFLGCFGGCAAAGLTNEQGLEALLEHIRKYVAYFAQGSARPEFWPLVWDIIRSPLLVFGLGFTALGVIGLPVVFFVQGFLFSFAVSSFYRLFGLAGQMMSFFLFGLSSLIWLPVLFQLGVQGILASYSLLRRAAGEGRYPLRYNYRYMARCGLCCAALCVCVGLEYLAIPALLQAMARGS